MKNLNWINVVATLLILAGVFSLLRRFFAPPTAGPISQVRAPATRPITDAEIKDQFIKRFESTLDRPMNDVEKQMITVDRHGDTAKVTVQEPLKGRLIEAQRQHAAASTTQAMPGASSLPMTPSPSPSNAAPLTPMPPSTPTSPN